MLATSRRTCTGNMLMISRRGRGRGPNTRKVYAVKNIVNAGIRFGNARGRCQQIHERTRGAAELLSLQTTGLHAQELATQTVWSGLAGGASATCVPGSRRCPWMPWPTTIGVAARGRTSAPLRRPPRCWRPSGAATGSKCVSAKAVRTPSRKASTETRFCLLSRRHTSRLWSYLLLLMHLLTQ